MRNCSDCGKKLKWFEGHITSDGEFCEKCYSKRKNILEQKEKKQEELKIKKEKEPKDLTGKNRLHIIPKERFRGRKGFLCGILIFIILLIIFNVIDKSNQFNNYASCINDCIYDIEYCPTYIYGNKFCLSYEDNLLDKYVSELDYNNCVNELEYCVLRCGLNYKN